VKNLSAAEARHAQIGEGLFEYRAFEAREIDGGEVHGGRCLVPSLADRPGSSQILFCATCGESSWRRPTCVIMSSLGRSRNVYCDNNLQETPGRSVMAAPPPAD
jgi:hypothetical protein